MSGGRDNLGCAQDRANAWPAASDKDLAPGDLNRVDLAQCIKRFRVTH
jgi:hypothetical protein